MSLSLRLSWRQEDTHSVQIIDISVKDSQGAQVSTPFAKLLAAIRSLSFIFYAINNYTLRTPNLFMPPLRLIVRNKVGYSSAVSLFALFFGQLIDA